VVIPSLPGYGFSSPLTTTGINYWRTADLWVTLMRDVLGYKKFAAQGGDWGALITAQLGHKYAEYMIGVHVNLMASLAFFGGGDGPRPEDYGPGEEGWLEHNRNFLENESATCGCNARSRRRSRSHSTTRLPACAHGLPRSAAPGAIAAATSSAASARTICARR
jgi:pimeloyl-ACP methyl ester carboxylesterase